jgi:NAD(P)-dependent dehydrogenase (short-subunit alcohol dehydrogenase family)
MKGIDMSNSRYELNGRTAVITGASIGLGREIARILAGRGVRLVLAARRADLLEQTAAELRTVTDVEALPLDVSENAERLIDAAVDRFGGIDILVNNASELGPSPMPRLLDYHWSDLERVMRVNVLAPLHLIQLAVPRMHRNGGGVIFNITSDAGVNAYAGWGGYGSSKAALEHLSRILAAEIGELPVRLYVVDPGDMNTEMHRLAEPGVDLSHLPGPEGAAAAIVKLAEAGRAKFARVEAQRLMTRVA